MNNNNRRIEYRPKILGWFGNLSVISNFLNRKFWCSPWAIMKITNSYFRALGVVAFACNPLTGILIFSAMVYGNPHIAIASIMTAVISILTCKLISAPDTDVCEGFCVFNSILVGSILTTVLPPVLGVAYNTQYWIILAIAGFLTNFIDQGLQSMMSPSKLPVQSVPFNIVASLCFLIFRVNLQGFVLDSVDSVEESGANLNETVDWNMVLHGAVCGAGQIYGVGNLSSSIMIWLGFFLYSPLLTFLFYVGSFTGALLAVLYNVQPLTEVYAGLWSFNSLLAAGGITYFVAPTPLGVMLAIVNSVIAVSVQAAITPLFMQTSLPVLSYPFNVAIMFTLAISLRRDSPLKFVQDRTFPEEHLMKHYNICGSEDYDETDDETEKEMQIIMKI